MSPHLSELAMDRLVALDATPEASAQAEAHLRECEPCRVRLRAIEAAHLAIAQGALPSFLEAKKVVPKRDLPRWLLPLVAGVSAVAVVVSGPGKDTSKESIRTKGNIGFVEVYVQRAGVGDAVPLEGAVAPGDVLQWVATLREPRFVAIVGTDGAGTTALYYPPGDAMAQVAAGERLALESSLTMDAVPGVERLRVVMCREPKALADVKAGLPTGCDEQRIDVPKSPR